MVPRREDLAGYGIELAPAPLPLDREEDAAPELSVVVPLLNEEHTLTALYDQLTAALECVGRSWEVVFVDDGSTDGSFTVLAGLHARFPNVSVVRLRRNFGKAAALAAGFQQARGGVIITMDADLQDDPAEIPKLLAKLDEGFDLVSGWKEKRNDPASRRWLSHVFNSVTGRVTGVRIHDVNCGLKVYRAPLVHRLRLYGELHRFVPVMAHQYGFRITEIPVNHRPREHGRSRYGIERYLRGFLDLVTVSFMGRYRNRPLHLFGGFGVLVGLTGAVLLMYLTILKFTGSAIGERPLLILGALLVVVGVQLFSLGLISELFTNQHAERSSKNDQLDLYADEILR